MGSDAEMHTVPEADLARNGTTDRKSVGVGEFALVAIRRLQEQQYALTGAHLPAADHCVARQRAPHELQHSFEAHHLFERLRNETRVVDECLALITMSVELQQPTGDDFGKCLTAPDEQRRDLHCDLVVAERQAVTVRERDEAIDHVAAAATRIAVGPTLRHRISEIRAKFEMRGQPCR